MMYSGDEDYGDEITSGIFPGDEIDFDTDDGRCPECDAAILWGESHDSECSQA